MLWYFASIATKSPALNLANRASSCKITAQSHTRESKPNVDALCSGLTFVPAPSQNNKKKQLALGTGESLWDALRMNFLHDGPSCSVEHRFSALFSLVELNLVLQLLCQHALGEGKVSSMPPPSSSLHKAIWIGMLSRSLNLMMFEPPFCTRH